MKKLSFLLLPFFLIGSVTAQNTEYSLHLNSGLFSFGGKSAAKSSFIVVSDVSTIQNYTSNPYGKQESLSYGLAIQVQRITKHRLILGLQSGYELLKSRVQISAVSGEFMEPPSVTSGETILTHGFITFYPHVGKRFKIGELGVDLTFGPEFGFNTLAREKGEANTENSFKIETDKERNDPGTDIRLRPSLTFLYKNWGISGGYSYGLHNYSKDLIGGDNEKFSRFIRFGISYKF